MPTFTRDILRFGAFALHRARGQLIGEGGPIALRPKSFALLCHFVEQAGRLLAKDELARVVWKDAAVTDKSIARCVSGVRKALGDRHGQLIRTLPGRGYLFDTAVNEEQPPAPVVLEPDTMGVLRRLPSCLSSSSSIMAGASGPPGITSPSASSRTSSSACRNFPTLQVVADTSADGRAGPDAVQAGRRLGVRYVTAGSVRRTAHCRRFTIRLVDVRDSRPALGRTLRPRAGVLRPTGRRTWRDESPAC